MTRRRSEYVIGLGLVAVAVIFVLVVLIVRSSSAPGPLPACVDTDTRENIRALALRAFDEAYIQHVGKLFVIWVQDPKDQPKRASAGMQTAISALIRSRALAQQWNPPAC